MWGKPKDVDAKLYSAVFVETGELADKDLTDLVVRGYTLHQDVAAKTKELEAIKAQLKKVAPEGGTLRVEGMCDVPITVVQKISVPKDNIASLRTALGARYEDLVTETVTASLSKKLKDLVVLPDNPTGAAVRGFLTFSNTLSVTWKAVKD